MNGENLYLTIYVEPNKATLLNINKFKKS